MVKPSMEITMPVSFQYTRIGETEPVLLNTIDELICNMNGDPVDEQRYHSGFQFLQWTGTAILMWGSNRKIGDGYQTDKETVEAFLEFKKNEGNGFEEHEVMLMRRLLYEEFTYKAWR